MQADITEKKPILQTMTIETEHLIKVIKKESEEVVEPKKKQIEQEEEIANRQAQEAHWIKVECEKELEKAMPLVNKAIAALNTIKPGDINELRVLGKPPTTIKKVLHAVCIMAARKPEKTPKPDNPKV
jgi:dynein heavy chain, axonemal